MGAGNLGGGRNLPVGGRPLSKPEIEPTKFRVYDKATGAPLWDFDAPARPLASPMTYSYQGKQYIVVAGGSGHDRRADRVRAGVLGTVLRLRLMRKLMRNSRRLRCLLPVARGLAFAQALPNISSLQVRYNALKTAAKAEGELKAQLDDVDKAIAEARRSGNTGEMRRQIAKGFTLLEQGGVDAAARLSQLAGAAQRAHRGRFVGAVRAAARADLSAGDRADAGADDEGDDSQARAAGAAGTQRRRRRRRVARARHVRRRQPRPARVAVSRWSSI